MVSSSLHISRNSRITGRFRSDSFQLLNGTNLSVNGTSSLQSSVSIDTTLNEKLVLRGSSDPYFNLNKEQLIKHIFNGMWKCNIFFDKSTKHLVNN